jgi:hypothetical protein
VVVFPFGLAFAVYRNAITISNYGKAHGYSSALANRENLPSVTELLIVPWDYRLCNPEKSEKIFD